MKLYIHGPRPASVTEQLLECLSAADFDVVTDPEEFDFVLPVFDKTTAAAEEIAQAHGKYFPPAEFIDKTTFEAACLAADVAVLPSMPLSELADCTYNHFIIKPKVWSGGKHWYPWVYRIFAHSELADVVAMIDDTVYTEQFFVQTALIDPATNQTGLLFLAGVVNGAGDVHFNSISEKQMLNPDSLDSFITTKASVRPVSDADRFGFKEKVAKFLAHHQIKNTPFKAQAIIDYENDTCYINDWSWGIMPYVHLILLDSGYLIDHLKFAYDLIPEVTKPIDKVIVLQHIEFPAATAGLSESDFDQAYLTVSENFNVKRLEPINQKLYGGVEPVDSKYYVLYGTACDRAEDGQQQMADFQNQIQ